MASVQLEALEQAALIDWVERFLLPQTRDQRLRLLHHVPNAGKRAPWRARREGVKAGVPDLHLPVPGVDGSHSLWIEMKVVSCKDCRVAMRAGDNEPTDDDLGLGVQHFVCSICGRESRRTVKTLLGENQDFWVLALREHGNTVVVACSWEQAAAALIRHLDLEVSVEFTPWLAATLDKQ